VIALHSQLSLQALSQSVNDTSGRGFFYTLNVALQPTGAAGASWSPPLDRYRPRRHLPGNLARPQLSSGVSNCLESQAGIKVGEWYSADHRSPVRAMVLRMVKSFRMQATSASFFGFPAAMSR
jgi:hypothetical protein